MSGNPSGRQREKPFREALDRAIVQDEGKRIRKAAEKLLDLAADGEPWAIQMLADRLDGRAAQTTHVQTDSTLAVRSAPVSEVAAWLEEVLGKKTDFPALPAGD